MEKTALNIIPGLNCFSGVDSTYNFKEPPASDKSQEPSQQQEGWTQNVGDTGRGNKCVMDSVFALFLTAPGKPCWWQRCQGSLRCLWMDYITMQCPETPHSLAEAEGRTCLWQLQVTPPLLPRVPTHRIQPGSYG